MSLPTVPRTLWIVRVLVPDGDIWRPEKPIRSLDALPAVGDPIALDDGAPGRVSLDTYTFVDHGTETTVESLSVFRTEADRDRIAGSMEPGVRGSARRLARLLTELTEGTV